MIKSLYALSVLALGTLALSAQDAVTVSMNAPAEVTAGQEFLVTVDIDKGNLEEFSRFQQELPAGFTAVQDNSGSADFSFDNQRVRFIWLKLPPEPKLGITYRVKVHERLKGTLNLAGEFSYVENNERKSIAVDRAVINVAPSPDVPADKQVEIASFASVMASEKATMTSGIEVSCIRQTPYVSSTGNDIMVHLLVYKKDMNRFAKIEETVPPGFEARSMESNDGLFTFKDGIAKFVWMNLPEAPGFKISYRLIPEPGKSLDDVKITGVLSYIMEGRNVEVDVVQKDLDLSTVNESSMAAVVAAIDKGTSVPVTGTGEKKVETVKSPVEDRRTAPAAASSKIPPAQLLPVYDGVYFRVQLAAMRHLQDAGRAFAPYRLSRPVLVEQHQGLYKYTAGSFPTYGQAREFKNNALSRGIEGAFIVPYRNGKRIDIMDALQATGGK